MPVFYEKELEFLKRIYKKYNLSVMTFDPSVPMEGIDGAELLKILGRDAGSLTFYDLIGEISDKTVYRITDHLKCSYVCLKLPESEGGLILMIGPYATEPVEEERVLEYAELLELEAKQTAHLLRYYRNIPLLPESSRLFTVIDAFCDIIWEGETGAYKTISTHEEMTFVPDSVSETDDKYQDFDMEILERRYELENQIMEAVRHGRTYKGEMFIGAFSPGAFERRLNDSVRNAKNYMIIMNTLLRKAAQEGGVHPFYLDRISSRYAAEIEAIKNVKTLPYFMRKMFEDYCRLVNKHATRNYSKLVKNVIIYVERDLSADISLKELAALNEVSATYLSTTFKKETGKSFVEFVNGRRIENAKHLLKTTRLQVQTVAQHCGFMDVQYFAKVFKKYTGVTPREYRGQ